MQALVFEELGADSGCIYIDNLRLVHADEISFSGYDWWLKNGCGLGPGLPVGNSFCKENVSVDVEGHLHLKIASRDGDWCSSEVVGSDSFGYGTYAFTIQTPIPSLDDNAIIGLYTYDPDATDQYQSEIDFEFGRWGEPANDNAQYVIQPWDTLGNRHRFDIDGTGLTTHVMTWGPNAISFESYYGHFRRNPAAENVIESWVYTGDNIPLPGDENIRMNLWLDRGEDPAGGEEVEVVLTDFLYLRGVPTVSRWGMLAMILLVLVGGVLVAGQRRPWSG